MFLWLIAKCILWALCYSAVPDCTRWWAGLLIFTEMQNGPAVDSCLDRAHSFPHQVTSHVSLSFPDCSFWPTCVPAGPTRWDGLWWRAVTLSPGGRSWFSGQTFTRSPPCVSHSTTLFKIQSFFGVLNKTQFSISSPRTGLKLSRWRKCGEPVCSHLGHLSREQPCPLRAQPPSNQLPVSPKELTTDKKMEAPTRRKEGSSQWL